MARLKKKGLLGQGVLNAVFVVISLMYILPFVLVISISFTKETELMKSGFSLFPKVFSTAAYELAFTDLSQVLNSYRTTIIASVATTALSLLVMGFMAYPMSRPNYKYGKFLSVYVLITMFFSGGMVPSYILITKYLHLKDNILVYILPALVSGFNLVVIRTNYRSIPEELIEAAKLDGASEFYICSRIVMPLSVAVMASIGFMIFVGKWNDWTTAMLYIDDPNLYSLQYLLQKILNSVQFMEQLATQGMQGLNVDNILPTESFRYAMAIISAGPVLVIFPFFQKYFSKGMLVGGMKG